MNEILVLSTVHNYLDARIFKEIISLKKIYDDITFIVPTHKKEEFYENGIKITPLPIVKTKFARLKLQKLAWQKIKKLKPDIVHFHDPELIVLGFFIKKYLKIKVIFDIHENVVASIKDNIWVPKIFKPIVAQIYSLLEASIINLFDGLIIAEKSYKSFYNSNAVEILNYPLPRPNKLVRKNNSPKLNFVYVGDITELRGIYFILDVFKEIYNFKKNVQLHLVGRFSPPSLEVEIKEYMLKNNLTNKIVLYGQIHILKVYKILENMHIGFAMLKPIDNHIESLPTKIFDYMINGVVSVVSNFPIYDEYITKPQTGITVQYGNVKYCVEKILEICGNKNRLKQISDNGIKLTNSQWNWITQEEKLLQFYNKIL